MRRSVSFVPLLVIALLAACGGGASSEPDAAAPFDGAAPAEPAPFATRTIAASSVHACASREAGLFCWGQDIFGEVGTGAIEDAMTPVRATEAGGDIVEVAARTGRTCVRRSSGQVACWGANESGEIGDGTQTNAQAPVAAQGLEDAVQLAIDDAATCALRANGRVMCWGGAPPGASAGALVPVEVAGLADVVELRDGVMGRFCARAKDQTLQCWLVADGVWSAPGTIDALRGVRSYALTNSDVVCAIVEPEGEILCHNLTSGTTIPLGSSKGSMTIVGGLLAAAARRADGSWAVWNVLPSMLESVGSEPLPFTTEVPLVEVALGGFNVCATRADDGVVCANANAGSFGLMAIELPL